MESFENSPVILAVKADLRVMFLTILDTLKSAVISFYNWLKDVPLPVPPTMLKLFGNNKANFFLFGLVVVYLLYINIRTYLAFGTDKKHAVKKKERTPERTLLKYVWLGGAVGGAIAMLFFRHKTLHKNFTTTVTVLLFVQLLLFSFVLGFLGFWTFF